MQAATCLSSVWVWCWGNDLHSWMSVACRYAVVTASDQPSISQWCSIGDINDNLATFWSIKPELLSQCVRSSAETAAGWDAKAKIAQAQVGADTLFLQISTKSDQTGLLACWILPWKSLVSMFFEEQQNQIFLKILLNLRTFEKLNF